MFMWCISLQFLLCLPAPSQSCREKLEPKLLPYVEQYALLVKQTKHKANFSASHFNESWMSWSWDKAEAIAKAKAWGEKFKQRFDEQNTAKLAVPPLNNLMKPAWWEGMCARYRLYLAHIPVILLSGPHPTIPCTSNTLAPTFKHTFENNGFYNVTDSSPPWADEPQNTGRPLKCYEKFELIKKCDLNRFYYSKNKQTGTRFYYDAYSNDCKKYDYFGCGGTENIFTNYDSCKITCMTPASPYGCSTDSGIKLSDERSNNYEMYP